MHPVLNSIKNGLTGFLNLLWPPHCAACNTRTDNSPVCDSCFSKMKPENGIFCPECGGKITGSACPRHPHPTYSSFIPAFHFCDIVRDLIHLLKYSNRRDIGLHFGEIIYRKASREGILDDVDALVPIPLHKVRERDRGYNQSEVIAKGISLNSGIPVLTKGIGRKKNTVSQTKLDHDERQKNVEGAFEINLDLTNKNLIIIDDVITTGATTRELAKTIARTGGVVKNALCIARPGLDD